MIHKVQMHTIRATKFGKPISCGYPISCRYAAKKFRERISVIGYITKGGSVAILRQLAAPQGPHGPSCECPGRKTRTYGFVYLAPGDHPPTFITSSVSASIDAASAPQSRQIYCCDSVEELIAISYKTNKPTE